MKEKTIMIFDGDLAKVIVVLIIATGVAAMGNKVYMFLGFKYNKKRRGYMNLFI